MDKTRRALAAAFGGTFEGEQMKALSDLYDRVEEETAAFTERWDIRCPEGCGECCAHFMPDLTPVEAKMIAAYLICVTHDLVLIDRVQSGAVQGRCPLWDAGDPHHCQVYAVRPLICRLFNACASTGKEGESIFRSCRFDRIHPKRILAFPEKVPVMDDYGMELSAASSGEEAGTEDLDKAVSEALGGIRLVASLLGITTVSADDDDNNDDSTPSPVAV